MGGAAASAAVAARPLVDSHCHLDYLERDGEIEPVVVRALQAGVGTMVTICTRLSEFDRIEAIARRFPRVFCSVGVHPHEAAKEGQQTPDKLIELAARDKVVGIGETGLDYFYEHAPRDAQQVSFRAHIAAARETGLPLIVHARDADDDTVAVLREEYAQGAFPGVIHCFTAGPALATAALEIGFYISLAGIVTFKSAQALRDTVRDVPLERLLVETDSPYLAPVPKRGKANEPANVVYTAAALAELRGVPAADFADLTTENFFRLFTRALPA
ncbi:MAG: TatD family hydrolase [Kiloniellaceae bacterium]